eukprot:UC1_evm1s1772
MAEDEASAAEAAAAAAAAAREEMKRKRLARFATRTEERTNESETNNAAPKSAPTSTPTPITTTATTTTTTISSTSSLATTVEPEPSSLLPAATGAAAAAAATATATTTTTTAATSSTNMEATPTVPTVPTAMAPSSPRSSLYVWAHEFIAHVFEVHYIETPARPGSASGGPRASMGRFVVPPTSAFMPQILTDLDGVPDADARQVVDTVVLERLNSEAPGVRRGLPYLIKCFQRADDAMRRLPRASPLCEVAQKAMDVVAAYAKLILGEADGLFPADEKCPDGPQALLEAFFETTSPMPVLLTTYMVDLCVAEGPESVEAAFGPVLERLRLATAGATSLSDAIRFVKILQSLLGCSSAPKGTATGLAALVVARPDFLPSDCASGRDLEYTSFLGPFLRPTVLPDILHPGPMAPRHWLAPYTADSFFPSSEPERLKSGMEMAHRAMDLLSEDLLAVFKHLLRAEAQRDRVFAFFSACLNLNARRSHDPRFARPGDTTSTDGFMMNVASVLLGLSEKMLRFGPTLEARLAQMRPEYLVSRGACIDVTQETALAAADDVCQRWREENAVPELAGADLAVSRQAFHALHALHLGFQPVAEKIKLMIYPRLNRLRQAVEDARGAGDAVAERRLTAELGRYHIFYFRFVTGASQSNFLRKALQLHTFCAAWMQRLADPGKTGVPADPLPAAYSVLPQYLVDDMADFLINLTRLPRQILGENIMDQFPDAVHLVRYFILALQSNGRIHASPYVRGKLVEVLAMYAPERYGSTSSFFTLLQRNADSLQKLGPGLFQFYVDVEETDFYGKLSMRNNAQLILKDLWSNPASREGLVAFTTTSPFVNVVMFLINDTTYCLDEARASMRACGELRTKLSNGNFEADENAAEVSRNLSQQEQQTRSLLQLAYETLNMFGYLTADARAVSPFLRAELASRLSGMLTSNLEYVAGSKAEELGLPPAVAKELGYEPFKLLTSLVDVFVNCSGLLQRGDDGSVSGSSSSSGGKSGGLNESFLETVARDPFYKEETLGAALRMLKQSYFNASKLSALLELRELIKAKIGVLATEEEDLGEPPDEFLDPILCTLMRDPVKLPSSGTVVDRSTMLSHLLSDGTDPFNRAPLTAEELIDMPELKAKIFQWVATQLEAKRSAK